MKRTCFIFCLLILVFSLSFTANASENGTFQTAGDLWQHWSTEGCIPNFITGVWSTDGGTENLTFGLLPGEIGEEAKQQILGWVLDDSSVTFVTQTYSRNYLFAIMDDVNTYFEKRLGFTCAGPNEYDNVVYIELHRGYESNPDSLAAVAELREKYGSAVSISFTDSVFSLTLAESAPAPMLIMPLYDTAFPASPLPLLLLLSMAMVIALMLTERRRRLLTHVGAVEQAPLSIRQVTEHVRTSVPKVPATLDSRVNSALEDLSR